MNELKYAAMNAIYAASLLDVFKHRIYSIKKVWSGDRIGLGTPTTTTTELTVKDGYPLVDIDPIDDILLSQNEFSNTILKVSLVPEFTYGGTTYGTSMNAITTNTDKSEMYFVVYSDEWTSGKKFKRIKLEVSPVLMHLYLEPL